MARNFSESVSHTHIRYTGICKCVYIGTVQVRIVYPSVRKMLYVYTPFNALQIKHSKHNRIVVMITFCNYVYCV